MDHPEIAFGEDGDFVSIWAGLFGSQEAVDAYTEEQYERDGDPISPFAADIGLTFYDHDFIEVQYKPELWHQGIAAVGRHSYGDTFAAPAAARLEQFTEFDTLLLLYGYDRRRYPQSAREAKKVWYAGTFPFRKG